ncbi:hypothetical protein EWM64_g5862 [Hericium alpestre]|uniref:Uncharacterized protein n=1 Tax=Hericium alpestre TaxID=135208 RepID=A0A4Y9ZVG8_9AGAM|nr:hypothetical protein EWM64_g5862 [Hericium alpestre]
MLSKADDFAISDQQTFWSAFVLPQLIQTEGISPRDKSGAVAHARRALNDELSAMHRAMCSLRTRLNALCPISALPAEALARIFQFCADMYPPASYKQHRLGWIEVTHVCRHWRDTALQFPSLWGNICYALGSQWGETVLARAKVAPISLLRNVGGASQSSLARIFEHLSHTRELRLVGPPDILKVTVDALPSPPGILETLEICATSGGSAEVLDGCFELPEAIAGCRLPLLRRLCLRGFWVPWSAPILCGLTCLEMQVYGLRSPVEVGRSGSSREALFRALRTMPALENLILKDCLTSGPWKVVGSDVYIQLPRLKVLQLQGPSAACFGIAKRLHIPASCQVHLLCNDIADIMDILPFLAAHVSDGADLPSWHTLSIARANWNNRFCLKMWRLSDAVDELDDMFNPKMYADLAIWFHSPEQSLRPLEALCQNLQLQTIQTLLVDADVYISYTDWIDLFGQCRNVDWASISSSSGASFLTALGTALDYGSYPRLENCGQEDIFLGKLGSLRLSDADFRDWRDEGWDIDESVLASWLTDRRRVEGIPEFDLELAGCSIKAKWAEALEYTMYVEWDRDEGECKNENEDEDRW